MSSDTNDVIVIGGGQSGLAAARALRTRGVIPLVLEAGAEPVGSWPHYYASLALFSPAAYSAMPDVPFPADPGRYPRRDEVVDYLRRYAAGLDVEIRTRTRVVAVEPGGARGFVVRTADGQRLSTAGVVAASGAFANPHRPELPGQGAFTGQLLHVADYRNPEPYAGQRVVVVGAGNSAVQVAYELARVASVSLAARHPIKFLPQHVGGRDLHYWLTTTGFDRLPPQWLARLAPTTLVLDTGDYRAALEAGRFDQRRMFTALDGDQVTWPDGSSEHVDTVLLATGYRPALDYLQPLGALDDAGMPLHTGGLSTVHPGLAYLGLEFQRSFSSNTLRGVHGDADHVIPPLVAHITGAGRAVGLAG